MKHLWSPWRSIHINSLSSEEELQESDKSIKEKDTNLSIFSRLVAEDNDEENLILWRGDTVFIIMNLYPYNNGHIMIIPYRQVAQYEDLTTEEMMETAATIDLGIRAIKKALKPDGINVGMNLGKAAGAGIPDHMHVHIVPRWHGDTNFMPTIGEVKVISESLKDSYAKLKTAIASLSTQK